MHIIVTPIVSYYLNNDLWFLISSGRLVEKYGFITKEMLSFHNNFDIIIQQWPIALLFSFLYDTFGPVAVAIVVILTTYLIAFMLYKIFTLICKNHELAVVFTAILVNFMGIFITCRPYVFSILVILLFLYGIEGYINTNNKKFLWLLPASSVILVNIHASMWPMLFVVALPTLADMVKLPFIKEKYYDFSHYDKKPLFIALLSVVLLGFVNPYGWKAMTYVFGSYGIEEINKLVIEMKPLFANPIPWITIIFGVIECVLLILVRIFSRTKKFRLRYIYLLLGTGFMYLINRRNYIFFIVAAIFELAYCCNNYIKGKNLNEGNVIKKNFIQKIVTGLIIFIFITLGYLGVYNITVRNVEVSYNKIFEYLDTKEKDKIVLYTDYDKGGHAEFYGYHPYIDPRAEIFLEKNNHQEDVIKEYYNFCTGDIKYQNFIDKYDFTHIIVTKNDKNMYQNIKKDTRYKKIVEDGDCSLYELKNFAQK